MSEACGLAGMRVEDFYNSTPREVANVMQGFYRLEQHRQEHEWYVGRSIAAAVMCSMIGGKDINYEKLPFFPPIDRETPTSDSKLSDEKIAELSDKMEDMLKNPDKYNVKVYGSGR